MAQTHTLGLRGHFAITSMLQNAADHYGVRIASDGNGAYEIGSVISDNEEDHDFDIDTFAPSFIEHDGNVLSRQDTKALLDFMNQPFRVLAERRQAIENPDQSKKERFNASHKDRVSVHRLLRFATTGSVEIPPDIEDELEKETAECHAKTEQAMRDMDSWRKEVEIGNPENVQSAVPHSSIEPDRGFVFELDEQCFGAGRHQGIHQETLNTLFWRAVGKAKGYTYDIKPKAVSLTASELETFYDEAHNMGLNDLIDQVEFEEAVQEKLQNVADRKRKIEYSAAFQSLTVNNSTNSSSDIKKLMGASSALKPIIESKAMQDVWARYNFTERHNSPMEGVGKEYAVFLALMDAYSQKDDISQVDVEALAQEFAPLLAFSDKVVETLQDGFEKSGTQSPARNTLEKIENNFKDASVAGISISDDMLKEDYQDILSALEKSIGQGGSALSQTSEAAVDTALDFTMDVVNFIKESPKVAATFVGLATTLFIMNGASPEDAQAAAESIMVFGENGLEEMTIDSELLPEEARNTQNWHWDMGPLGMYKHYMYDNAVVGPAQTIMDWMRIGMQGGLDAMGLPVNPDPAFSKAAESTADSLGKQLFNINLFQNASHAAFWMYMVSKGYNHGFKGANKIFDLMSPLTDLSYTAGVSGAEALHLKKATTLSDRLIALTQDVNVERKDPQIYGEVFQRKCALSNAACVLKSYEKQVARNYGETMKSLVEAAHARLELEETLPDYIEDAAFDVKMAGIQKHFKIGASNYHKTLQALDKFDLTLENMADHIGVGEPWYQHYVRECLENVTNALRDYQDSGNAQALQDVLNENLQNLVAIQVHHTGASPLYAALMGEEPDERGSDKLKSSAKAQYGQLKRENRIHENREKLQSAEGDLSLTENLKARATILGTALWGGVVGATRKVRQAASKTLGNKPTMIAASGLAAACVALDMASGGNAITSTISSGVGGTVSAAVTTTTFAIYNFWEDVLGVHVGSGLALLAAGAGAGYAYKKLLNPLTSANFEMLKNKTGVDAVASWEKACQKMDNVKKDIAQALGRVNHDLGARMAPAGNVKHDEGDDESDGVEEDFDDVFYYDSEADNDENYPSSSL